MKAPIINLHLHSIYYSLFTSTFNPKIPSIHAKTRHCAIKLGFCRINKLERCIQGQACLDWVSHSLELLILKQDLRHKGSTNTHPRRPIKTKQLDLGSPWYFFQTQRVDITKLASKWPPETLDLWWQ
jgi:hypothetical protein